MRIVRLVGKFRYGGPDVFDGVGAFASVGVQVGEVVDLFFQIWIEVSFAVVRKGAGLVPGLPLSSRVKWRKKWFTRSVDGELTSCIVAGFL